MFLCVCPSVCLSLRHIPVLRKTANGIPSPQDSSSIVDFCEPISLTKFVYRWFSAHQVSCSGRCCCRQAADDRLYPVHDWSVPTGWSWLRESVKSADVWTTHILRRPFQRHGLDVRRRKWIVIPDRRASLYHCSLQTLEHSPTNVYPKLAIPKRRLKTLLFLYIIQHTHTMHSFPRRLRQFL